MALNQCQKIKRLKIFKYIYVNIKKYDTKSISRDEIQKPLYFFLSNLSYVQRIGQKCMREQYKIKILKYKVREKVNESQEIGMPSGQVVFKIVGYLLQVKLWNVVVKHRREK